MATKAQAVAGAATKGVVLTPIGPCENVDWWESTVGAPEGHCFPNACHELVCRTFKEEGVTKDDHWKSVLEDIDTDHEACTPEVCCAWVKDEQLCDYWEG